MLSSVCKVTSWLSTCGGFREHLINEARGNFEWLMLSGSRALEFLGSQGVTALGNLVLSRRDLLLLDVRSTVEEVAREHYAALPSSAGLFPSPLLDSALDKMCTALNDALVQKTLHPLKIPRKSLAGPVKEASTSAASADYGGTSPVVPRSQKTAQGASSSSAAQQGRKRKGRKGKVPFSSASSGSGGKRGGTGKKSSWQGVSSVVSGVLPVSALEALAGYWGRVLCAVRPVGRVSHPLPGLPSSPRSHPDIVSDVLVRVSSVTGSGPGDREDVGQGCLGNCPRSGSQLLQSSFSGEKATGGWRPMIDLSHLKEFVLQSPFKMETVASVLLSVWEGDFLASIDLKDTYFQIPVHQPSRKLLRFLPRGGGGGGLPVQSPVIRTVVCPSGLHQGVCSGLCMGSLPRDSSSQVLGWLADPRLFGGHGQKERPGSGLALLLPRDSGKRGEVRSRSLADCKLPRYDHQYWGRQDFSCPCAGREISVGGGEMSCFVCSPRSALGGAFGAPGFAGEAGSSVVFECAPCSGIWRSTGLLSQILPRSRYRCPGRWERICLGGWCGPSSQGGSIQDTSSRSTPVLGCVSVGVGYTPRSFHAGVWSEEEKLLYINFLEMKAMFLALQSFREVVTGRRVTAMCGVPLPQLVGQLPSEVEGESRRPPRCEVSTRSVQCPGRSPQLSGSGYRDWVVSPPSGGESSSSRLGLPVAWLVLNAPQHEASPILLPRPGSPGSLWGCASASLGQPGCVSVSTLSSRRKGGGQSQRDPQSLHDFGCPSLAGEGVVRRPSPYTDPTTSHTALLGPVVAAAPLQLLPPRHLRAATLQLILRMLGFLRGSALEMSSCVRTSTFRLYQGKWMLFCG